METVFGAYVLIWPVISLGVLAVICRATLRDWRKAKKTGREMV